MHTLRVEAFSSVSAHKAIAELTPPLHAARRAPADSKTVAAVCDFHAEPCFYLPQVLIELTTQVSQPVVVGRLEYQVRESTVTIPLDR